MQDEATPHRTREVFQAIHKVYGNRVIGLGYSKFAQGGIEWPPYSWDLNPCDYSLWGHIEHLSYANNPRAKEEFIAAVKKTVGNPRINSASGYANIIKNNGRNK